MDPKVVAPFDVSVTILTSRTHPSFREAVIIAKNMPPELQGNYHIQTGSPAIAAAGTSQSYRGTTVNAPPIDYDGDARHFPLLGLLGRGPDIGADEIVPPGVVRLFNQALFYWDGQFNDVPISYDDRVSPGAEAETARWWTGLQGE
jgi:hypothetical protein